MKHKLLLQSDVRFHALFSIDYRLYATGGRACRFFAEIKDEERRERVALGGRLDVAYRIYSLLVENEVAPCHVWDVIEDLALLEEKLEV